MKITKITEFLGLKRSVGGVLAMVILIGMGERMAERFLPIYLLALGGGTFAIGLLSSINNLLGALYSLPGGYLADKLGTKKALLVFNFMALTGYLAVIFIPSWKSVITGSVLFLSWTAISLPATMSLVARVLPQSKRTMGVTVHSLVRRFPMALGPIIGGFFIGKWGEESGIRYSFIAAFFMATLSAIIQQILIEDDKDKSRMTVKKSNPAELLAKMNPLLKKLLVADILVRFCEQIPAAFVVVWCMKTIQNPVSAVQFGILTSIEMAVAILIYIPVAYLADKGSKKPFVVTTFAFFTIFPVVLFLSTSYHALIVAFVFRGLKEFGEPTRKALIMDLAPENEKAAAFGLYYLIRDAAVSLAALGGAYLWSVNPSINFVTASCFGLAGTLWFAAYGKDIESRQHSS